MNKTSFYFEKKKFTKYIYMLLYGISSGYTEYHATNSSLFLQFDHELLL